MHKIALEMWIDDEQMEELQHHAAKMKAMYAESTEAFLQSVGATWTPEDSAKVVLQMELSYQARARRDEAKLIAALRSDAKA